MAPKWGRLLTLLGMSQEWKQPPSTWLGLPAWGVKDQLLTLAHQIYRTELCCGCCGVPTRWAHGIKTAGGFWVIKTQICNVAEARDSWQAENAENKPIPGQLLAPVLETGA